MLYYAIKHKPTGNFLPQSKRRAGFTYDEPQPLTTMTPRLFTKKGHATTALNWWLAGHAAFGYARTEFGGDFGEEEKLLSKKVPIRKPEDMEVVEICLTPVGKII